MIDRNLIGFTTSANGYTLLYNGKEVGGVHFTEMPKGNMAESYNYCYELALAEIEKIVVKEEGTFAKAILNEVARFQNRRYEIELTRKELDIITDALNPHIVPPFKGESAGETARLFKKLVDIKYEKKN